MLILSKLATQTLYVHVDVDANYSKISILMESAKCWIFPDPVMCINFITGHSITLLCRFTGCVKLKGVVVIGGDGGLHPKDLRL